MDTNASTEAVTDPDEAEHSRLLQPDTSGPVQVNLDRFDVLMLAALNCPEKFKGRMMTLEPGDAVQVFAALGAMRVFLREMRRLKQGVKSIPVVKQQQRAIELAAAWDLLNERVLF